MTTDELKTNGYAIKYDKEKDSLDRLRIVLKEMCPHTSAVQGSENYYYLNSFYYTGNNSPCGRPIIFLNEVQLMSEVELPLPRMVEVRVENHEVFKWFEAELYAVGDDLITNG
jgi:hypothetical protein